MPQHAHITFRGEEDVRIEYEDGGYEPDTNAHEINWWIADDRFPLPVEPEITEEEDNAVLAILYERSYERDSYEDW